MRSGSARRRESGEESQSVFVTCPDQSNVRVVNWLEDKEQEGEITLYAAILDVGCGNGVLSIDLFKAGFSNITG